MWVSVILSTYDSPEWLEKVLWGYAVQTHRDFEILVADDGSDQRTSLVVGRMRRLTGLVIRHVWHEDRGFRKAVILNRATAEAEGDYLVFTDGDCVPRHDFLATHIALARPGCLLSGGCVRLPRGASERIEPADILARRVTDMGWLAAAGATEARGLRMLRAGPRTARLLDAFTTTRPSWNGCNSSTFRRHILAVNGHDERMRYGGLDREMGERLVNLGIQPVQVRHRAVCLHLDHDRPYANAESWRENLAIRAATRANRATWTAHGIERVDRPAWRRAAG
jgi:glycosyltransferase involved in cell wall biosynthesis